MTVRAHDPHLSRAEEGVELVSLPDLLKGSDIVSLHVPLDAQTRCLIGSQEFALMRPDARLINTSRGAIVDEQALLGALQSGRLGGAGLDVLTQEVGASPEWLRAHPLVQYARAYPQRLIITPHIGGATRESMEKTEIFMAQKLRSRAAQWSSNRLRQEDGVVKREGAV